MDQALAEVVFAALVHDIGKFAQRAKQPFTPKEEVRPNYGDYKHPYHTDYFMKQHLPLPREWDQPETRDRLARLAAAHHKPNPKDPAELAITRGDRLSAATDRKHEEELRQQWNYLSARLVSIFRQLSLEENEISVNDLAEAQAQRLVPLEEDPFPVDLEEARKEKYPPLFQRFLSALSDLPCDQGLAFYLKGLVTILERFTWGIPSSSYHTLPDVSLFDHSLTTAAIAQALWVYYRKTRILPGQDAESQTKFRLLGGDLSGIQGYIFGVKRSRGTGVAKLFRARSFHLQILTRAVWLELLRRLELFDVARIMDAGGRFILLLPETEELRRLLPDFEREVQEYFFQRFHGRLTLNLYYEVTLTEEDLERPRFLSRKEALHRGLEERKLQPFHHLLEGGRHPVMPLDFSAYQENGVCELCDMAPAEGEAIQRFREDVGEELAVCGQCQRLVENLGKRLPRAGYLVIRYGGPPGRQEVELFGGLRAELREDWSWSAAGSDLLEVATLRGRKGYAHLPVAGHLPTVGDEDLQRWQEQARLDPQQVFIPTERRMEIGQPKTFTVLAEESRYVFKDQEGEPQAQGAALLGVFKADVDNLGFLFGLGLGDRLSISRYVALSRMLNHFFSEYLVELIQKEFPDLYVVFAGGDDVFLLGPWTGRDPEHPCGVVEFSLRLQEEFRRYVACNPEVTISAGVVVVKPRLPVQAIAAQAEQALERAKHYTKAGDTPQAKHHPPPGNTPQAAKNAVTMFDTTVGWEDLDRLLEQGDWLYCLVQAGKFSRGLLMRLLHYHEQYRRFQEEGYVRHGLYRAHMRYDFARNLPPEDKFPGSPEGWERIMALPGDETFLGHARLPVSYALYRLREE